MRQTIAYIVSAAMHIALAALLLPTRVTEEEAVIDLPEQLTIDLQVLPELKPVFSQAVKPAPIKKVQKKITKIIPINQTQAPSSIPLKENKVEESNTEVKAPTAVVVANMQAKVEPITHTKQQMKDQNESLIIHNPTYQSQRPIKYPKSAKRKKLQGTVIIRATIDSSGYVQKAWVHESSGHSTLDRSAIKSVKGWIFTPAQQGNLTIVSTVQFPVVFQLK